MIFYHAFKKDNTTIKEIAAQKKLLFCKFYVFLMGNNFCKLSIYRINYLLFFNDKTKSFFFAKKIMTVKTGH